ncbi:hypothetical protein TD95_000471 [Thielaviopsis punctulata]|uniref:SWR1-complex protein 3 domain-containing protein n=1 Tax=Thielaviopsis punctulata TaxID=72032 RepID=A0A0F4ZAS1_9PEZI|nr:hypothetical protein TD95_000471 [Thielaviopsis punctulata]
MEIRKRKFTTRSAARNEQVSKKRNMTPEKESRSASATPAPTSAPAPSSVQAEDPPTPLPSSIQAGKPLPTIETPQPEDLSVKDYQSFKESGVMAEALSRSRQKWLAEGLFEKYWTKPTKKKGAAAEERKNPAKDSMFKLGQVTISIEPHIFEATMFGVKDSKSAPKPSAAATSTPQQSAVSSGKLPMQSAARPILQYGPPNGTMPPPAPSPIVASVQTPQPAAVPASPAAPTTSNLAQAAGGPVNTPTPNATQTVTPAPSTTTATPLTPPEAPSGAIQPTPAPAPAGQASASSQPPRQGQPATPAKTTDPIIVALAERASNDENLRDIMKKVAEGRAISSELSYFQQVIDQITALHKKPTPAADRLMVDGRSVKYFADEVNTILGVVLRSNPNQRAVDLRPPNGSDPLVVAIVREALDNPQTTRAIIHRIAVGTPRYTDPQDLQNIIDNLFKRVQSMKARPAPLSGMGASKGPAHAGQVVPAQPARSKLPAAPKATPDISAVVFEFAGTTGDRYLFPKFSILNPIEGKAGGPQQVIASFLIVRKGSTSEYGGDPELDYYQPVTIKMTAQSGRHLENLARVVAPEAEVRRYMDDVMDHMTRAEYVLLAMRLPRTPRIVDKDDDVSMIALDDSHMGTPAAGPSNSDTPTRNKQGNGGVNWGSKTTATTVSRSDSPTAAVFAARANRMSEEQETMDKYRKLVDHVSAKDAEVV